MCRYRLITKGLSQSRFFGLSPISSVYWALVAHCSEVFALIRDAMNFPTILAFSSIWARCWKYGRRYLPSVCRLCSAYTLQCDAILKKVLTANYLIHSRIKTFLFIGTAFCKNFFVNIKYLQLPYIKVVFCLFAQSYNWWLDNDWLVKPKF